MNILENIFSTPSEYLSIFETAEINELEFYEKDEGKFYIKSFSQGEEEKLVYNAKTNKSAPEEIVRQLFLKRLIEKYKYPKYLIEIEKSVSFGREKKRADIVIFSDDNVTPYIIAEIKSPKEKNSVKQLKSYLNAEGAPIGVAINGLTMEVLHRPYPKDFSTLPDIPEYKEEVEEVFNKKFKYEDLKAPKQLKQVIQNLEDLVLSNSGYDSFDEIFKIIYAKIYDEVECRDNPNETLKFRARKAPEETKKVISELFENAKNAWKGIFDESDKIKLRDSHLSNIVADLQEYSLMESDLKIIDDTFEYLIPDVAKGKKGQYFTPRHVIDMCIRIINPKRKEYIIDTACGSGGFLIHTMNWVRDKSNLSTENAIRNYAEKYLWGIDFDERSSKISKAMMLIAGDGKSHIYKENSLDSTYWKSKIKDDFKEEKLVIDDVYSRFSFDVLLANPPFAGNIDEEYLLKQYTISKKGTGKYHLSLSRHILFIERNLNFVKAGGRLAIVLPQGVFNNTSEKYIREFISDKARILGVVGLEGNTFKPHTGTKTSVMFLQKWDEKLCPKVADYPIFFATSTNSGKNNSGDYVYKENNGKQVLQHDLNDIAEAFCGFAKSEGFSFS